MSQQPVLHIVRGAAKEAEAAHRVQGRKLRKSIADMQSSHEAQVNAVMDKYNSLRTKVSAGLSLHNPLWMDWTGNSPMVGLVWCCCLMSTSGALQVAEYHEALKEAMGMGSVAVGVKALHIR